MCRGKVLNRASRVASKATAGLVLASAAAWSRACKHPAVSELGIGADLLGEFEMKGVAGPMTLVSCRMAEEQTAVIPRVPAVQAVQAVPAAASSSWEVIFPKPPRIRSIGLQGSGRAHIDPGSSQNLAALTASEEAEGPQPPPTHHGPAHRLMQSAPLRRPVSAGHMPNADCELSSPGHDAVSGAPSDPSITLFTLNSERLLGASHVMDGSEGVAQSSGSEFPDGLTGFPLSDESFTAVTSGTQREASVSRPVLDSIKAPPDAPTAAGPSPRRAAKPPSPTSRSSAPGPPSSASQPSTSQSTTRISLPTLPYNLQPSLSSSPNLLNSGIVYTQPTPLHIALANARVASRERSGVALHCINPPAPAVAAVATVAAFSLIPAVSVTNLTLSPAVVAASPAPPSSAGFSHLRPRMLPHHGSQGSGSGLQLLSSAPLWGASWPQQQQQEGLGVAADRGPSSLPEPPNGGTHSERLVWRASDI